MISKVHTLVVERSGPKVAGPSTADPDISESTGGRVVNLKASWKSCDPLVIISNSLVKHNRIKWATTASSVLNALPATAMPSRHAALECTLDCCLLRLTLLSFRLLLLSQPLLHLWVWHEATLQTMLTFSIPNPVQTMFGMSFLPSEICTAFAHPWDHASVTEPKCARRALNESTTFLHLEDGIARRTHSFLVGLLGGGLVLFVLWVEDHTTAILLTSLAVVLRTIAVEAGAKFAEGAREDSTVFPTVVILEPLVETLLTAVLTHTTS